MIDPDRPDLARRHRDRAQPLDALNDLDQLLDVLLRLDLGDGPARLGAKARLLADQVQPQRGLVPDHDGIDVAVAARERNGRLDLALVAGLVLVYPDAERNLEPELGGGVQQSQGEREEVERLRRELRDLQAENALLKKAAALFAKDVK